MNSSLLNSLIKSSVWVAITGASLGAVYLSALSAVSSLIEDDHEYLSSLEGQLAQKWVSWLRFNSLKIIFEHHIEITSTYLLVVVMKFMYENHEGRFKLSFEDRRTKVRTFLAGLDDDADVYGEIPDDPDEMPKSSDDIVHEAEDGFESNGDDK